MIPGSEDRQTRDIRALVENLRNMAKSSREQAKTGRSDYMHGYDNGGAAAFAMCANWIEELLPVREEVDA